jgi:hypothetical protein
VSALDLFRRPGFRRLFFAVAASELGDAFHYIALMWFALVTGGPFGVIAVRLADSVPAILFGFHGGLVADRMDPKRILILADLVRGAVLLPIALLGLSNRLPLWGLVVAAFVLEASTSYFAPAYGVLLPAVSGRENVQSANGLVRATANAVSIGGWGIAAVLLAVLPMSAFFAVNAASFFVSAALIASLEAPRRPAASRPARPGDELREGFRAVRQLPGLAVGVVGLAVGVTIATGSWIGGVPDLVRTRLGLGASGFSIVMIGYALGSVTGGLLLARWPVRNKTSASLLAWTLGLPAFVTLALAHSLAAAVGGGFAAGVAQTSAVILLNSAAQETIGDSVLGRVMGLISLVHRGAHATALLLVSPLYAMFPPERVFVAAGLGLAALGLGGATLARLSARQRAR